MVKFCGCIVTNPNNCGERRKGRRDPEESQCEGRTTGMPTYELVLLLKKMPMAEVKSALKRTAMTIFETGGVLRKIENLGLRKLPYRIRGNLGVHSEGNFFVYQFDAALSNLRPLSDTLRRDMDLVRQRIYFIEDKLKLEEKKHECDIYLDMLEVPDRPHVQLMVEISKKNKRKPFMYGGGRDYDPIAK